MSDKKERKFYNLHLNNNVRGVPRQYAPVLSNYFKGIFFDGHAYNLDYELRDTKYAALIIAELVDGKMIDFITREELLYNKDKICVPYLSFYSYELISREIVVREFDRYEEKNFYGYKSSMQQVKDATVENYKKHLEWIEEKKKMEEKERKLKNIINDDDSFNSFMDNIKKRTRK